MKIEVNQKYGSVSMEVDKSKRASYCLMLAHGAGAGMYHPFMADFAQELSKINGTLIRFNFPFMEGVRKSPGAPKQAWDTLSAIYSYTQKTFNVPVFMSGKSYGGRMSSHWVADHPESLVKGLVYLGFPLHAPGKDSKDRANHLSNISIPQLFLQGSKDKLANIQLIQEVIDLLPKAKLHIIDDADHSFKVPKRTGKSYNQIIEELAVLTDNWIMNQLKLG